MKKNTIILTVLILAIACNKDKNKDKYIPPYNLTRYTKKMAGKWNWHGEYKNGSYKKDTGGTFEIVFINDTVIKFRETVFRFVWRDNLLDSNLMAYYYNPVIFNIPGEAEGISYFYRNDKVSYNRYWGQYEYIRLEGIRK